MYQDVKGCASDMCPGWLCRKKWLEMFRLGRVEKQENLAFSVDKAAAGGDLLPPVQRSSWQLRLFVHFCALPCAQSS